MKKQMSVPLHNITEQLRNIVLGIDFNSHSPHKISRPFHSKTLPSYFPCILLELNQYKSIQHCVHAGWPGVKKTKGWTLKLLPL